MAANFSAGDRLRMTEIIDSHHHLWRYAVSEYGWINDQMHVLRRDFLPGDLHREMADARIDGALAVQARQTVGETRFLLECAEQSLAIRGVVGWLPIAEGDLP